MEQDTNVFIYSPVMIRIFGTNAHNSVDTLPSIKHFLSLLFRIVQGMLEILKNT